MPVKSRDTPKAGAGFGMRKWDYEIKSFFSVDCADWRGGSAGVLLP
jgi:hypothetical protein